MERPTKDNNKETKERQIACTQVPTIYSLCVPKRPKGNKLLQDVISAIATAETQCESEGAISGLSSVHYSAAVHDIHKRGDSDIQESSAAA